MVELSKNHGVYFFLIFLLLSLASQLSSARPSKELKPCKHIVLHMHGVIFNGSNLADATGAAVTSPVGLGNFFFGQVYVFDNPMTKDQNLLSPPMAQAQGFYFYHMKTNYSAWMAFTLVFNSTEHKGTIDVMGSNFIPAKTRNLSIVGGTGDFFMARGILEIETDAAIPYEYYQLKMNVKLYECY
ncbi:hypothetical protein BT93_I1250 [Corymbia citriodora subsp. variegata]|nr:hypothetical protein BT93_I1250 [Corymbia citriodora subsp. variegata]